MDIVGGFPLADGTSVKALTTLRAEFSGCPWMPGR